ncbi:hypothetical protein [Quadrisphaera sp. KR29]|uniref:hypothetical protein n=1 Tax=Quadrisphaera sp. KR29 TaxID=3461391 RepID=UPI004043ADB4
MSTTPASCARSATLSALSDLLGTDADQLVVRLRAGEDLLALLSEGGVELEALTAELEQRLAPALGA